MAELTAAAVSDAADAGPEAVVTLFATRSEAERRAVAAACGRTARDTLKAMLEGIGTGGRRGLDQRRAALELAILATATPGELAKLPRALHTTHPLAADVLADRQPAWGAEWVDAMLARGADQQWGAVSAWALGRRLVVRGVVPTPASDDYIHCMIGGARNVATLLAEDPALLGAEVWRIFEVEGTRSHSLAGVSKYTTAENTWEFALLALAGAGRLDRAQLLDATLGALARDFPAYRAGWFSRFWTMLEPTDAERQARVDALLGLLGSTVATTVALALAEVARCAVDPVALVDRLVPVVAAAQGKTVRAALGLLEAAGTEAAAIVAARAAGNESADVQKRALETVRRLGGDPLAPAVRAALEPWAAGVAASVRPLAATVLGAVPHGASPPGAAVPYRASPPGAQVSSVVPIGDVDELADVLAAVIAGRGSAIDSERALDGISRFCAAPFPPELKPLLTRARKVPYSMVRAPLAAWATRTTDETPPTFPRRRTVPGVLQFVYGRADEVAVRAAAGHAAPLLALPTHSAGWIEGAAADRAGDPLDTLQAQLRQLPGPGGPAFTPVVGEGFRGRPIVTVTPNDPVDGPVDDPARWLPGVPAMKVGDVLPDGGGTLALLWPAGESWIAACGLLASAWGPAWSAHFAAILAADMPIGPAGAQLLVRGLDHETKDFGALAADTILAAVGAGRLDGETLGAAIALAVAAGANFTRMPARLAEIAPASPTAGALVRTALEHVLATVGEPAPRDLFRLLEPLNEACAAAGAAVADGPAGARAPDRQLQDGPAGAGTARAVARATRTRPGSSEAGPSSSPGHRPACASARARGSHARRCA